jgi:CPA1 family monovalent cation:H+ antiporter
VAFPAHDALVLLALLGAGMALLAIAPSLRVPYPILLVLGGLALGFTPGIPHVTLNPRIVLVAILPPLLYGSAFFVSLRDLRRNARAVTLLSLGLVLTTTVAVAAACHAFISGLTWPVCFVIGAIVAPTDAVAASVVSSGIGLPRRIVAILEGESLMNDATALVAYRFAVVAVVTGTFSLWHASWRFVVDVLGGVAIGLAVGYVLRQIRRRLDHSPTEIAIALCSGYFAYLPAAAAGVSAVLAAVTVSIYVGWYTPELTNYQTRLQGDAVWEIVTFLLNALLFVLVGLQLRPILDSLSGRSPASLVADGAVVSLAVIVTRFVWLPIGTYVPRFLFPSIRRRDPYPPWQWPAMVSWAGMRGAISLAAALALPLTVNGRKPFPDRELIIYLTFCVILVTLVLQGGTVPLVARLLGLEDDGKAEHEESKARYKAAQAALARLDELVGEDWVREDTAGRLRGAYTFRSTRFASRFDPDGDGALDEQSLAYQRLRRELLDAERAKLVELRRQGAIGDEVMNRIQRDLDLEDARLEI